MKGLSTGILIVLMGVLVIAAVTNPTKIEFVEHCKTVHVERPKNLLESLFSGLVKKGVGWIAEQSIRHNYVVCSVYELGDQIYIGAFGNFYRLQ